MVSALIRYELSRMFRSGGVFVKLVMGGGFGAMAYFIPEGIGMVPVMLPVFVLMAGMVGWIDSMQPNAEGEPSGSYMASRPISRGKLLMARTIALGASGAFLAGLLVIGVFASEKGQFIASANVQTYARITEVEKAGHAVTFKREAKRECYEQWKVSGEIKGKRCREHQSMASIPALNPWLLTALIAWVCVILGGLYTLGRDGRSPGPNGTGWSFVDEWGSFAVVALSGLFSVSAIPGMLKGPMFVDPLSMALNPWIVPAIGCLLVGVMYVLVGRRVTLGDIRS